MPLSGHDLGVMVLEKPPDLPQRVEIRDRDGRLVLSGMNPGGTVQSVSGTPPFDIVIGNAGDVRLTYKGSPVDLAPHTRQNVARFKLP